MLAFELDNMRVTEFGVGRDNGDIYQFLAIPVDGDVRTALADMAQSTWNAMREVEEDPAQYQPAEKHGSTEYLLVQEGDDLEHSLRQLHNAENLPLDANALQDPSAISCYFGRFTDGQGQRLTALRRASHFKGVLNRPLLRINRDTLELVEDDVFKLDNDFDLLLDSQYTHILRPAAFESLAKLRQAILDAVPTNIASLARHLDFIDVGGIETYASTHPRAARYLASIRTQNVAGITRQSLGNLCRRTGVQIDERNGLVAVSDGHVMGFLEVLDRRRYEVELVVNTPEQFRATSRRRIET